MGTLWILKLEPATTARLTSREVNCYVAAAEAVVCLELVSVVLYIVKGRTHVWVRRGRRTSILERLPQQLREILSTPSGHRPCFLSDLMFVLTESYI